MNTTTLNITKSFFSAIAILGLTAHLASAKLYSSLPPEPSLVDEFTGSWYIDTSDDGIDFYVLTPFKSERTPDGNIYVNGAVMADSSKFIGTKFVQVDCGRFRYREIMPALLMDKPSEKFTSVPADYGWQRFKQNTVFLDVGKAMCGKAGSDRGLEQTGI